MKCKLTIGHPDPEGETNEIVWILTNLVGCVFDSLLHLLNGVLHFGLLLRALELFVLLELDDVLVHLVHLLDEHVPSLFALEADHVVCILEGKFHDIGCLAIDPCEVRLLGCRFHILDKLRIDLVDVFQKLVLHEKLHIGVELLHDGLIGELFHEGLALLSGLIDLLVGLLFTEFALVVEHLQKLIIHTIVKRDPHILAIHRGHVLDLLQKIAGRHINLLLVTLLVKLVNWPV